MKQETEAGIYTIVALGAILIALSIYGVSMMCGCSHVKPIIDKVVQERDKDKEEVVQVDQVDYRLLQWTYGGFNGSGAAHDKNVLIDNLSITSKGMSYSWVSGGCENIGASGRGDYSKTLACLFVLQGGVWRGGKFDWISSSRLTRDWANINGHHAGYGGWDETAIDTGDDFCFVIVAANGKSRTNVIKVQ